MTDVRMPDGTIIKDVPDGITQAELNARLSRLNNQLPQLNAPDSGVQAVQNPRTLSEQMFEGLGLNKSEQLGPFDEAGRALAPGVFELTQGFQSGLKNAASGARQLFNFDDPAIQQEEQQAIAKRDSRTEALGGFAQTGSFVGEVAPSAVLPGGPTGGIVRRVVGGAATDLASSVADPVREDQTRTGNLATTAAFSGGARSIGGLASGLFRRLTRSTAAIPDPEIRKLVEDADANEIRIFFDDVTDAPLAKKASVAAEYFGLFGTSGNRIKQNEEALDAATRWLQRVSGDVDNYDEVIQEGLKNKLNIFRKAASRKYARVANEIGNAGVVPTNSFDNAAQSGIDAELAKGTRANKAVQDFLAKFKDAPRGTFDEMIEFRSDFNKQVRGFMEENKELGKSSIDAISGAQRALDNDMAAFAKANGAEGSWRAANEFYRNTVVQFKTGKLKNLVNEKSAANFDEQAAWRYLVSQSTNPKRAQRMWASLDRKGREAVRFGLIKEALDKATIEGKPFSPARFASSLEKRLPVAEQFFRGQSGDELKGLIKVMRHIERAGQFAENPPTGQRLVPLLLAGGATVAPTTVAVGASGALGIKTLFQTKAGRNLLLGANQASEGSEAFSAILEKMERVIARGSNQ